jgi:glycosyltransferase involved in cell wall biosynthesis
MVQSDFPGIYPFCCRRAQHLDLIVGMSKQIVETLASRRELDAVPKRYVQQGVSVPAQVQLRDYRDKAPLRILYLGRLDPGKRVRLFPEILRQLRATGMPFVWTIAGDGPEKSFLEQAMVSADVAQSVRFIDKVAYRDVPALLQSQDVFLLASDHEGMPLSLLEAMGAGLVPVVSDLPSGVGEVVNETTGKLVALDDIAGYARAICWLHEHREAMTQMALAAQRRVREEFSVSAMTDRWLALAPLAEQVDVAWPARFAMRAPLDTRWPFWFHEPFRTLRRVRKILAQ